MTFSPRDAATQGQVYSRLGSTIFHLSSFLLLFVILGIYAPIAQAQSVTAVTAGTLRSYSTIYSIGVEWDVSGDTNYNAAVQVEYRPTGSTSWSPALPLMRVDYNGANMLAGSVLFLNPDTIYEVKLTLTDPDGGAATQTLSVKTRPVPAPPASGRTFHVVPGSGGGDGSASTPFQGVATAQAVAQPGDTFLLHSGSYGGRISFDKPGTAVSYLVWKGAGDGEVTMNGIDIAASHIWLEGLTVRNQSYATFSIAAPENVVVKGCNFFNNHYSIYLQQGGSNWYIADNTIVGDTPAASESFSGEGIELNTTSGHTVAYNSITNVADGISSPLTNVDIFGNDIFDTSDDGIEADTGKSNVRMWGNRIHNAVHNAISFQPQNGSPWYIIRNQIVSNKEAPFKFRTTDRFVLLHNTIINWGSILCCNDHHLFGAYARNNLWISKGGGQIWYFSTYTKDWRTDLDYDGFDWGSATNPFVYGGVSYADVASFSTGSGLEKNGRRVSKDTCFANFGDLNFTNPSPASVSSVVLTLNGNVDASGSFISPAINTGAVLPNVNDRFVGDGKPDLGANEYGQAVPSYGPRVGPPAPAPTPTTGTDVIWIEDAVPAGATLAGDSEGWNWISSNPTPFSGTVAHQSNLYNGEHQHYFSGATNTLTASTGDKLFAYVYLDPANMPSEVMLQWNDGTWEHRAYWGANQIGFGTDATNSRRYMGALPVAGQWIRLEVPASQVGLEGRTLNGMAFTLYGGRATWDQAGKASGTVTPTPTPTPTPSPTPSPTPTPTPSPSPTPTNTPPTVSMTSPSNGASFTAGANIAISANATDADGAISKVEFYANYALIGTATTSPYSSTWSNVAAGSYTLTAKAIDNAGATTTSSAINITVTTPAPSPSPDFSLSATPSAQTLRRGGQTIYTVTVTSSGGFTGTVTLSVSGLQRGTSASFSPASVGGSGASTMTVTTLTTAQQGTNTLTIMGSSGSLQRTTSVSLTVKK